MLGLLKIQFHQGLNLEAFSDRLNLPTLRFIGHSGERKQPKNANGRIMFIPDSNLVLNLLKHRSRERALPAAYKDYLLITRSRVQKYWHVQERWIPVNPTLSAMELSLQDKKTDQAAFIRYFNDFLSGIYRINNVDPRWANGCFEAAIPLINCFYDSLQRTVQKTLELVPRSIPTNRELEGIIDLFLCWLEDNANNLVVAGGEPVYLAIYAFAGSPDARRILKFDKSLRHGIESVSRNVAWDLMYLIHRQFSYLYEKYDDDIICTADDALADLLRARTNHGPRYAPEVALELKCYESFGHFKTFSLPRLEGDTHFSRRLRERLTLFYERTSISFDAVSAGRLK